MQHILITGGAGFIGSNLIDYLLAKGKYQITCIDNFNNYYDPAIKRRNLQQALANPLFRLVEGDITDSGVYSQLSGTFSAIIHLAAKAGVRPSLKAPLDYEITNIQGTIQLLEFARQFNIRQFVFASSSSVYGINPNTPWREEDNVLRPISPYAATKVACELQGSVYAHLYNIRFIALRLFTVYGPRQRPDLAIYKFVSLMEQGIPIDIYGDGSALRDFTYVGDIVKGIEAALHYQQSLFEVINLGNHSAVSVNELIAAIEEVFGGTLKRNYLPPQPGDVPVTYADTQKAAQLLGFSPDTPLRKGLEYFKEWWYQNR